MCCQVVTYDMMAAAVSTLAASIDPWQPAGQPSKTCCWALCGVIWCSEFTHEPERQWSEADAE